MSLNDGTEREYTAKVIVRHGWAPKPGDTILHAPSGRRGVVACITITEETATADVRLLGEGPSAPTSVWFLGECLWGRADLDSVVPTKRDGAFTQARLKERLAETRGVNNPPILTDDEVAQIRHFCEVDAQDPKVLGLPMGNTRWAVQEAQTNAFGDVDYVKLMPAYEVGKRYPAEPPTPEHTEWRAKLRCRLCGARGHVVATPEFDGSPSREMDGAISYMQPGRHLCSLRSRGEWELLGYEEAEWSGRRGHHLVITDKGDANAG